MSSLFTQLLMVNDVLADQTPRTGRTPVWPEPEPEPPSQLQQDVAVTSHSPRFFPVKPGLIGGSLPACDVSAAPIGWEVKLPSRYREAKNIPASRQQPPASPNTTTTTTSLSTGELGLTHLRRLKTRYVCQQPAVSSQPVYLCTLAGCL